MWCRSPGSREAPRDCAYFSVDDERLIGATYYARDADAFAYILLARDAYGRFQAFANQGLFVSARAAKAAIREALSRLADKPTPEVPMRPDTRPGVDLFEVLPRAKLNPKFVKLRDSRNASAGRELLTEIGRWLVDLDGNFVRDFQTTGVDGRVWELFLFAALTELDFRIRSIRRRSGLPSVEERVQAVHRGGHRQSDSRRGVRDRWSPATAARGLLGVHGT
jgi:hypothetical protein